MSKLTAKQKKFVDEYLIDLHATNAAIRAGYAPNSAAVTGHRLLANSHVSAAIDQAKTERSHRVKTDADWVLQRLVNEAEADLADIYDGATGALKPVSEWPEIWRQGLVAGVETREERDDDGALIGIVQKVRLSDRIRRLELIGKHVRVNAFQEVVEHKGLSGLADRIHRARKRAISNERNSDG
jgi:phage terminase small subunit